MKDFNSKCAFCYKEFYKAECEKLKTKNDFCSRTCAGLYNSPKQKKRKPEGSCISCQEPISKRKKFCKQCSPKPNYGQDMSLSEAIYNAIKSSKYGVVRYRARVYATKLGWNKCAICKYDKHIEICHIKPISEFSGETLLSVINHHSNLLALCPNHHWEFDNKFND